MIIKPNKSPYRLVDKQDLFNKILQSTDFRHAKNSLEAVKLMFNAVFPTIERVIEDNETLLIDSAQINKNFAELDEKYKKLVIEHDELRKKLQDETPKTAE